MEGKDPSLVEDAASSEALATQQYSAEMEGKDPSLVEDATPSEDFFACDVMGSGPEAAESDNSWGKCMKHPGHANFIPISEFCSDSLPEQYRSQSTVNIVKAIADLTVKLVVRHNSADRMTYSMFCYSMSGDTSGVHVGSGWVMDIEEGDNPCPGCPDCTPSSPPCSPSITPCSPTTTPFGPSTSSCSHSALPCAPSPSSPPCAPSTPLCAPSPSSSQCAPTTPPCAPSPSSSRCAPSTLPYCPSTILCAPSPSLRSPACAPSTPPSGHGSPPCCTSSPLSAPSSPQTMVKEQLKWFDIYVASARHVVFNDDEAQATEVQIFYDDRKSRKDKRMKSVYGRGIGLAASPEDSCIVVCRTHNATLATELKVCLERMRNMVVKKDREEVAVNPERFFPSHFENKLCIMISHPHGQPKMVTLGQASEVFYLPLTTKLRGESGRRRMLKNALHYDTKSCPGSSGAPVFMPTCIETRQKSCISYKFIDALVIRPHSIGNVFGPPKSIGFSGGALPLQYFPLACLPGS